MENNLNYGSYGYIAMLDFNTAEKFISVESRVSVQYMQQATEKILNFTLQPALWKHVEFYSVPKRMSSFLKIGMKWYFALKLHVENYFSSYASHRAINGIRLYEEADMESIYL